VRGEQYKELIAQAAKQHGVRPELLAALLNQESGFNPQARSGVGAQGIAQFMPGTAKGMGVNPWDPKSAIPGAAQYLHNSIKKFGSEDYALASYNGGGGAVDHFKKHGGIYYNPKAPGNSWANQTGHYVKAILGAAPQFAGWFGGMPQNNLGLGALAAPVAQAAKWMQDPGQQQQAPQMAQPQPQQPLMAQAQYNNPIAEKQKWFSMVDNTWQPPV
jgi:hypothetical protein